jgi:translation initiation factor IF-2
VKQDLAEHGVLVEGWGGAVPAVPVSAKTGEGIPDLLEIISLQADLEGLKGDPSLPAEGFVIESSLNPKQGITATLIIKNGSLQTGQFIVSQDAFVPIRAMENYKGESLREATFSSPVRIVGWNIPPRAGSRFQTFSKREEALEISSKNAEMQADKEQTITDNNNAFLRVVIKTDTIGSLDAVEYELGKLSNEKISIKIISKGVGAITEKDLKTANIKDSLVLGFNVDADKSAEALALRDNTEIKTFKVIYQLVDYVKEKVKEATPTEMVEVMTGSAKILRIFSKNKDKQIVGGRVEEGEIKLSGTVKIFRRDSHIGEGKIKELQSQKIKAEAIAEGQEFGMMIESKTELAQGDMLRAASSVRQ